jgi:hypothetical protein
VIAAAVVAIMPLAIYYSQEVRMYGLVTLLGAMSMYLFLRIEEDARWTGGSAPGPSGQPRHHLLHLFGYVAVTVAALYTHYYAILIVLAQLIYGLATGLKRRPAVGFRAVYSMLLPIAYVGLLYLPWLVFAGSRLAGYVENKRNIEAYAALDFVSFFGNHPNLLYLYLVVPLVIGYLINLNYPFTPRYFERTLLLAAPAYWLFIAGGLVWLWAKHRLLLGAAAVLMVSVVAVSLSSFYGVQRYAHEDYRLLLDDIAARATPEDTLLASYQWQLGFYHAYLPLPRPKLISVPEWGRGWSSQTADPTALSEDIRQIFRESPRLWFPAYQAGGHIWEDEAETAIAELGYPAILHWYSPVTKLTLAAAAQQPTRSALVANFENRLNLLEAEVGGSNYEAGRDIVPIKLVWQKIDSLGSEFRVSLRLADTTGRTWATRDSQPRAGQSFFTAMALGDTLVDRHGFLTPAGAPPGTYRLLLSVRQIVDAHPLDLLDEAGQPIGAELLLAEIDLIAPDPPVGAAVLPVQFAKGDTFGQQVRLVGYSLGDGPYQAGETLPLTLFWEALAEKPGPLTVLVELKNASGQAIVSNLREPIWPATNWREATVLRDPHDFLLPANLAPGDYQLVVGLFNPDQSALSVNNGSELTLATVTTTERPHSFEAPDPQIDLSIVFGDQARLVGVDLPQTEIIAGQAFPVRLYWQAIESFDKNWTVFVHLTDGEGQIVSQQDQVPGNGQFPTTSWIPNEFLIDNYTLQIPAGTPSGHQAYRLKIGLYDPNSFSRLPVLEAGDTIGDHFTLMSWPISVE